MSLTTIVHLPRTEMKLDTVYEAEENTDAIAARLAKAIIPHIQVTNKIRLDVVVQPLQNSQDLDVKRISLVEKRAQEALACCFQPVPSSPIYQGFVSASAPQKIEKVENNLVPPVVEAEEEVSAEEVKQSIRSFDKLLKEFKKCVREKLAQCEETTEVAYEMIRHAQQLQKMLHKEYEKIADKLTDRAKLSKFVSWMNVAATIAAQAMFLGITAITFTTGGAGAALYALQGAALVVKGCLTVAEGILDYMAKKDMGEMTILRAHKDENAHMIRSHMTAAEEGTTPAAEAIRLMKRMEKALRQFKKSLLDYR